ncbi:MAG: M15 family metallopeptidase [Clostridiales bacterium]|nr:M15 family metallopeptidase [Clostridiales bacterium]
MIEQALSVMLLAASLLKGGMDVAMPDKNIDGTFFLINRSQMISEDYVPKTRITDLAGLSQSMREDAATALEEMFAAAKADGVRLATVSGYRSYSKQNTIYERKVASAGIEVADSYVALPGSSEHQLGLAMDVTKSTSSSLSSKFGTTTEGQWVAENAHLYGFIIRYQEGMEEITGYAYEPWHIRYIGKEYAKAVYKSGLPLDLYVSLHRMELYTYLVQQTNEVLP